MMKKLTLLVFLMLTGFYGLQAQKKVAPDWPGVKYASAKVFLYNLDNQLHGQYQALKNGVPNFSLEGNGTTLTTEQVNKLAVVLNSDTRVLNEGLSKCYDPHHAVFFYDEQGKTVAAFDVCFLCEGIRFYPSKSYTSGIKKYTEAHTKQAQKQLEQIKAVFTEAGIRVFKNEGEVNNYAQTLIKNDTLEVVNDAVFKNLVKSFASITDLQKKLSGLNYTIDSSYTYKTGNNTIIFYDVNGPDIKLNCSGFPGGGLAVTDIMIKAKAGVFEKINLQNTRAEINQWFDSSIPGYAYHSCIKFNSSSGSYSLILHFDNDKRVDHITYYLKH